MSATRSFAHVADVALSVRAHAWENSPMLSIDIEELGRIERFEATLGGRVLCRSRQPPGWLSGAWPRLRVRAIRPDCIVTVLEPPLV